MSGRLRREALPLTIREVQPDQQDWEEFGIDPADVVGWKGLGFSAFDAAMAQGDGYTPTVAAHYRRQLHKTADSWRRIGLDSDEGLHWHRAGFGVKEATRWRVLGVNVETARCLRDGYRQA